MPIIKYILPLLLVLSSAGAYADTIALNPNHPDRYVVVKGDTLWDISARFLRDPWRWPEVWNYNPQIENPHLIYPGDTITLVWRDGKPILMLERGPGATTANVVKLSPTAHRAELPHEVTSGIPMEKIAPFLTNTRIISQRDLDNAGYIVAIDGERLIGGTGHKVFARKIRPDDNNRFIIIRASKAYYNQNDTKNPLGFEAIHVGDAVLQAMDDPATFVVRQATREVLIGDKLLPAPTEEIPSNFTPHAPQSQVAGKIISVVDGVSRIGQYHVVVINLGEKDGMEAGHVLAVNQSGITVRDSYTEKGEKVTLPENRAGLAMVFKVFENVSYAIILEAYNEMRLYDDIATP